MKNLLKKPSILLILLFATLFFSCEKDLYEEAIHSSKKIKIREVKFKELSKDQKFSNLISLINDNNVAGRSEFEDQYGFTISDGNVKIIETDTVTSYTMLIHRDGVTDDSYFENLVFQEDIYDNRKVAIYKYTPNNITPTGHNSFHFDGTIDKFSLSNSSSLNRVSQQMSTMSDCYDYHLMCNYGDNEHPAGANCTRTYLKTFRVICASPSNGDGGDDGGGGGGGSGSGSPNDNPLEDNNDIITSPVLNNAFLDGIHYINQFNAENFYNNLTWQQQEWADENPNEYDQIIQYLTVNVSNESEVFAKELMQQMILNPLLNLDINISAKSPAFVDMSSINGSTPEGAKFNEIYNALKNSPLFRRLFTDMFNQTPFINVKFKIENLTQPSLNQYKNGTCQLYYFTDYSNLYNIITIDRNHLLNDSNLNIALTIIHEYIHAYLNVKLRNPSAGQPIPFADINDKDLKDCINTYYNGFSGNQTQHNFFADFMVPTIRQILSNVKDTIVSTEQANGVQNPTNGGAFLYYPLTNPPQLGHISSTYATWNWSTFFNYFAYIGLQNCTSYPYSIPVNQNHIFNNQEDFFRYYYIQVYNTIFNP